MPSTSKQQKDPVCGMNVDPSKSNFKAKHNEKDYAFCCQQCMEKFKKNPNQFSK